MSQDLFRSINDPEVRSTRRPRGTLVVSLIAHIGLLSLLVIVPLVATDALPSPATTIRIFTPTSAPPPPPPPPAPSAARRAPSPSVEVSPIPVDAPEGIHDEVPVTRHVALDAVIGGIDTGVPGGLTGGLPASPRPPDPPPPPPPTKPLRVSDGIRMPKKIVDVAPVYPSIAQTARREGVVLIEAVIDVDGHVRDARVLRSVTLLDEAALAAVRQWRYQPTLLNGVPVPVIVTVTVMFKLQ